MEKVLLIDDELELLSDRSKIIKNLGYTCFTASNGMEAINIVRKQNPDVILTDMKMPNHDGFYVLKSTMKIDPNLPVIIFTGYGSIESAVYAMKLGAYDFIQKPISPEILEIILKKACDHRKSTKENLIFRTQVEESYKLNDIVFESQTMANIIKRVLKVAKADTNVFIIGETGTGKEMIARNIHLNSPRKDKPFIAIDCVALPDTLLESEIFGFEKGAFTGAIKSKPGVLELADEGTLFFDEIADLKHDLQAKLLRVIQERQFRRLGGTKMISVNIRIISATNKNPEKALKENTLREDLYFRLNVVPIYIPPLRERKEDIPILVHHFINEFNPLFSNEIRGISDEAMKCLKRYNWPGNVRELKNVIEQAMSLSDDERICLDDLPEEISMDYKSSKQEVIEGKNFKEAKKECLNQFYKIYFENLLNACQGNLSQVAKKAVISRRTLYRILNMLSGFK